MKIKENTSLDCGCCGGYFRTWEGYEDQDQDSGYGICKNCQDYAAQKHEDFIDNMVNQISESLKPDNKAKFDKFSKEKKRMFAMDAYDKGMFTWKIGA